MESTNKRNSNNSFIIACITIISCVLGMYIAYRVIEYNQLLASLSCFSGVILGLVISNQISRFLNPDNPLFDFGKHITNRKSIKVVTVSICLFIFGMSISTIRTGDAAKAEEADLYNRVYSYDSDLTYKDLDPGTCNYEDCDSPPKDGKLYCHIHCCDEDGCNHSTDPFISYCDSHNCTYPGCSGDRYKAQNSNYCQTHYVHQ